MLSKRFTCLHVIWLSMFLVKMGIDSEDKSYEQSSRGHVSWLKPQSSLEVDPGKQTHVVTWIDPPCPLIGNFSRLHRVLYMMNVTDGRATPRNTIAEYDGKPRDCSIQRSRKSGKNGMARPSVGGGRDG